jgi:hypothetical protein
MIGIGKNRYKVLVTIVTLTSILIVNAIAIGTAGHIAFARHYDNTEKYAVSITTTKIFPDYNASCL